MSDRKQRRLSGVPQKLVIHERYRDESEDDDQETGYRVIKVIDLVLGASLWAVAASVVGIIYDDNFTVWDALQPLAFAIGFLMLVPIKKVDI